MITLPRKSTDPNIALILKREVSKSHKTLQFRPAKVNDAVQWLMRNNPHYIEAIKSKQLVFEPLPIPANGDIQAFQDLQIHFPLSEEEMIQFVMLLKSQQRPNLVVKPLKAKLFFYTQKHH